MAASSFTPSLTKKITTSGLTNLYEIVTYLPFRLQTIKPFSNSFVDTSTQYLYTGTLINISHRKSKRPFLVLTFQGNHNLTAYLFSVAKFTLATLKIRQQYQLLVTKKDNLWSIKRYSPYKPQQLNSTNFILGKAQDQEYLLPVYQKLNQLKNQDFHKIHQTLNPKQYILNMEGLYPKNSLLPLTLDLTQIHKPSSLTSFQTTLKQWISTKVYLKLALINSLNLQNQSKNSKLALLDKQYLQSLSSSLPFDLSSSQKISIWELLQDLTYSQ